MCLTTGLLSLLHVQLTIFTIMIWIHKSDLLIPCSQPLRKCAYYYFKTHFLWVISSQKDMVNSKR